MRRFELLFERLLLGLAVAAAVIFAAIALAIPVNVVMRNMTGGAIRGLFEVIEFGLLAATFLAAPWVFSRNGHVSVDLVVSVLPRAGRRIADTLANLIGMTISAIFFWYSGEAMLASYSRGSMVRATFIYPEWWTLAIIPVAMALIVIEFLRRLLRPAGGKRILTGL
jgi:TRAP-type C4-dicarboxylate transport system permease small subunit